MEENQWNEEEMMNRISQLRPPFTQASVAEAKSKVLTRTVYARPTISTTSSRSSWILVAAAVLALIAAPYFIYLAGSVSIVSSENPEVAMLPDGSSVSLAPNSSIEFNEWIWAIHRHVVLQGDGFFDVVQGERFTVKTNSGKVTVLGTKFGIWESERSFLVHCTEGKVKVESEQEVILQAGDYMMDLSGKPTISGKLEVSAQIPLYASETLEYRGAPLTIVGLQMARVYQKEIRINNPENKSYSGSIPSNNLSEALEIFCRPFDATYEIKDDHVVIFMPE